MNITVGLRKELAEGPTENFVTRADVMTRGPDFIPNNFFHL